MSAPLPATPDRRQTALHGLRQAIARLRLAEARAVETDLPLAVEITAGLDHLVDCLRGAVPIGDEVANLERALAVSAARSDIECYCAPIVRQRALGERPGRTRWWYDTAAIEAPDPDGSDHDAVATAVRYLSLLGLLDHHPDHPEWVGVERAVSA